MENLTSSQMNKALLWTGSLTEACAILDMPFRRAWNYVSGKPISVRPVLTGPRSIILGRSRSRIGKNSYTFVALLNLRRAETLLSAGLPGKTVQLLIDKGLAADLCAAPKAGKSDANILILYHDIDHPAVMAFPPGKENDFDVAFEAALEIGAARCVLSVGSLMQEVLRRTVSHEERRKYVAKSPRQIVKDALSRTRSTKSAGQAEIIQVG